VVLPWARRTARLDLLVFHLGIALGVDRRLAWRAG
jgi:hypothetical protein